ncbi:adenylate/guanylate cyclase domain-containing protein [Beggiatoa leptomitoformis]|uniref:adenylate/guanylate cyclase domain-containing protein n=1 Tax=Beggiatoa leptomitoformis TaxID=288004 RepID=UPI00078094D1|nr:adenylate/guanylate cyclase domain-containing protein [Beggiatoa leptomitoformis]
MFKNLKLKSKLLLSFFIVTCISTISTTIFSIYYFSDKIEVEAVENMKKNMRVAQLIYQNKVKEIESTTHTLATDRSLQVLVNFLIKNKINQYLTDALDSKKLSQLIIVDPQKNLLAQTIRKDYARLEKETALHNNILIKKALEQRETITATELIEIDNLQKLLAISVASPIFKSEAVRSANNNSPIATQPEVIGVLLARYVLNQDRILVADIENLLEVTAAIYADAESISFTTEHLENKPQIRAENYLRTIRAQQEIHDIDIRYGGQLAEYATINDINKMPIAVLGVSIPADRYVETTKQAVINLLGLMLLCIVVASIFGYLLARSILIPIYKLLNGVRRVTSGDLSYEIIMDLKDEFGTLASSFNSMSRQLQELFNTLEQRVQDATRKLQNTLAHMTAIIDNMADGLLVTDKQGKIIRYNPALLAMFPKRRDMLGKDCQDIFNDAEAAELARKVMNSIGEVYGAEISLVDNRVGQAVATAIIQKDTLSETSEYVGSKYIGSVILVRDITKEKEADRILKNTVETLTRVGTALSAENSLLKLLELFVSEARNVTNADGGTLYILEDEQLGFEIIQNKSLNLFLGGAYTQSIDLPAINIHEQKYVAYSARTKQILTSKADFKEVFDPERDKAIYTLFKGYRIQEILVVPLLDRTQNAVGVLQLINPLDPKTGDCVPFANNHIEIVFSLASQAAVAIENVRNYEKIERKNIAFKRFVPTEFLLRLGREEIEDVVLGDASQETMSVLFSDIRSFTTLSETMTPEDNFHFLNDYLDFIGPNITENGGFIDKYIGDAIMALFPGTHVGVADDAVLAAVGMLMRLHEYNAYRQNNGEKPLSIGVGIHTGALILGTIGFESRMESTVIGDTVNLASRMEGLTKQYGIIIGITSSTYQQLQHPERFLIREIDTVQVKGKEEAITVYEVFDVDPLALREVKLAHLTRYEIAMQLYKSRQWEEALEHFLALKVFLQDDKVINIYIQRCQYFITNPPNELWRGVTRLDEK